MEEEKTQYPLRLSAPCRSPTFPRNRTATQKDAKHLTTGALRLACPNGRTCPTCPAPWAGQDTRIQRYEQPLLWSGRLPFAFASASVMYSPCLVFPYQRSDGQW